MKGIIYSILSGLMMGLGAIILKTLIGGIYENILNLSILYSVIPSFIGMFMFQLALRHAKGSYVSFITAASAAITAVVGGYFIGEVLTTNELIGMIFIILSVIILILKNRRYL